jgi:hypothetical protein
VAGHVRLAQRVEDVARDDLGARSSPRSEMMIVNSSPPMRGERVAAAHAVAQAVGGLAQHGIPERVPRGVVDVLEVVEVDEQQRDSRCLATCVRHASRQLLHETAAGWEAS